MFVVEVSDETKEKMKFSSRGNNAKLTETDVIKIKLMLIEGVKQLDIAQHFEVGFSTINKIAKFKNWQYIREDLNEKIVETERRLLSEKRNCVEKLISEGKLIKQICRLLNCSHGFVVQILGDKKTNILEDRNKAIISNFEKGLAKDQIMDKYSISSDVYVNVTCEAYKKRKSEMKKKAIELRQR